MSRLPLHYQIFASMIIGAVVGLLANPGETPLGDVQVRVEKTDGKIVLAESTADGDIQYSEEYTDAAALEKRYKRAAELLLGDEGAEVTTNDVTERRVHFSEDGNKITVRYSRLYAGKKVVHSLDASNSAELEKAYPWLAADYQVYESSISRKVSIVAKFLGDMFLRLLKMITIPLIVTSLIVGVTGLGNTTRLGSMFGKTMLYYISTSVMAITTGLVMVNIIQPGIGVELPGGGQGGLTEGNKSLTDVFVGLLNNMIPTNPFQALARGEFLSIITFSILVGIFIIRAEKKSHHTMRDFFQAAFDVMMGITLFIIRLAPIGVLGFMAYATASQGLEVFKTFGWYMVTVFLALAVHTCVVLPLLLWFIARRSPWGYAKAMTPALLTAFSTASSNGTLPLTLTSVEERAGVPNRVSSFVLPLGATINMDGTALYEVVAVLFIAQSYNGFAMPLPEQIIVAVTALLASIGAAGIPSAGLVMMAIVLQAVGLPLDAQGLIIAVDRVLDMCRTTVNVWSDSCGCAVIARFENADSEKTSQ